MNSTVNELLVLMKAVRERLSGLKNLRSEVAVSESIYYGSDEKKIKEPQYDIKKVDAKISELEYFLLEADSKIKQSNAVVTINININPKELLAPLS